LGSCERDVSLSKIMRNRNFLQMEDRNQSAQAYYRLSGSSEGCYIDKLNACARWLHDELHPHHLLNSIECPIQRRRVTVAVAADLQRMRVRRLRLGRPRAWGATYFQAVHSFKKAAYVVALARRWAPQQTVRCSRISHPPQVSQQLRDALAQRARAPATQRKNAGSSSRASLPCATRSASQQRVSRHSSGSSASSRRSCRHRGVTPSRGKQQERESTTRSCTSREKHGEPVPPDCHALLRRGTAVAARPVPHAAHCARSRKPAPPARCASAPCDQPR
jgi:hypothetical protein